jgi:2-methylcitrate dehydratase PrpD
MGGQYSLPFTTAVALCRDLDNPLLYNDEALWDPLIRDLAQRIDLQPLGPDAQPRPHAFPLQAEIVLEANGKQYTLSTRPHKGSPHNPFTWDEVCEKFRRYTAPLIPTTQASKLIAAVAALEDTPDMSALALLTTPST